MAALYDPVIGSDYNDIYPLLDIETLAVVVGNIFEGYQVLENPNVYGEGG